MYSCKNIFVVSKKIFQINQQFNIKSKYTIIRWHLIAYITPWAQKWSIEKYEFLSRKYCYIRDFNNLTIESNSSWLKLEDP